MRNVGSPEIERPRERLLALGPGALSDAELVALLLRTGSAGRSALDIARALIARFDGVAGVLAAPVAELAAVHGVGPAKGAELATVSSLRAGRWRRRRGGAMRSAHRRRCATICACS